MRACGPLTDQLDSPVFHLSLGHPDCASEVLQRPPALAWCSPRQPGLYSCQRASQWPTGCKQSHTLGIRWLEVPRIQGSEVACPSARLAWRTPGGRKPRAPRVGMGSFPWALWRVTNTSGTGVTQSHTLWQRRPVLDQGTCCPWFCPTVMHPHQVMPYPECSWVLSTASEHAEQVEKGFTKYR